MIQLLPKLLTFDEFIEWLPEAIVEMQQTEKHEDIAGFLTQGFHSIHFPSKWSPLLRS